MLNLYFPEKLKTFFFTLAIFLSVFSIRCSANEPTMDAYRLKPDMTKPLYGAYPDMFRPDEVKAKIEVVASKYKKGDVALSVLSKQLLVNSLSLAAQATADKNFVKIASLVEKVDPTLPEPKLSADQRKHVDQFMVIDAQLVKNGKIVPEKGLDKTLSSYFTTYRSHAVRILNSDDANPDYLIAGLYLHNSVWAINRPLGMLWLYHFRVPSITTYLDFAQLVDKRGNLRGDQDVLKDAAFILGATQSYIMAVDMSKLTPYVATDKYLEDLATQKTLVSKSSMPNKSISIDLMLKVAKAQMTNIFSGSAGDAVDADRSWYRGSLFAGIMAAWKSTNDEWYIEQAEKLSERNKWEPGPNAMNDGNDLAISQTYLELYEAKRPGAQIEPTKVYLDKLLLNFNPNKVEWSWCDALFMSPPTWARMGKITGENKYFDNMDKLWWQTSDLIYDKADHLFYRDMTTAPKANGFQVKERNGSKIFWGRGNAWVMGGLCRVLDYLPADYPSRSRYETMFKEMCAALLKQQGKDGLWRVSLMDGDSYPMGETSASTFNCYAFAWGVNSGLLDAETYTEPALRGWRALAACVDPQTGKLGYVQLPADSPLSPVYKHCNVEYASGAFLLAGSQILKMLD